MAKPELKTRMVDLAYLLSVVAHRHTKRSDIEHALRGFFARAGANTILIYDTDDNTGSADRTATLGRATIEET